MKERSGVRLFDLPTLLLYSNMRNEGKEGVQFFSNIHTHFQAVSQDSVNPCCFSNARFEICKGLVLLQYRNFILGFYCHHNCKTPCNRIIYIRLLLIFIYGVKIIIYVQYVYREKIKVAQDKNNFANISSYSDIRKAKVNTFIFCDNKHKFSRRYPKKHFCDNKHKCSGRYPKKHFCPY